MIIRADPNTKIWSAGHDVHEIPLDGQDPVHWTTGFVQVLQRVRYGPMPVIAMLHSSVWGAACDLAVHRRTVPMKVGLFIPCYVDAFFPEVGIATLELLERLGCSVEYPLDQTCCGQPMANSGCQDDSAATEALFVALLPGFRLGRRADRGAASTMSGSTSTRSSRRRRSGRSGPSHGELVGVSSTTT